MKYSVLLIFIIFFFFFLTIHTQAESRGSLSFDPASLALSPNTSKTLTISGTVSSPGATTFQVDFKIVNGATYINAISPDNDITSTTGWTLTSTVTQSGSDILVGVSGFRTKSVTLSNTPIFTVSMIGKTPVSTVQPIQFLNSCAFSFDGNPTYPSLNNGSYITGSQSFINNFYRLIEKFLLIIKKRLGLGK